MILEKGNGIIVEKLNKISNNAPKGPEFHGHARGYLHVKFLKIKRCEEKWLQILIK